MTTSNNSGNNDPRRSGAGDDFFDDTHSDIDVPVYRREANADDKTRPVSVYDRLKDAKDKITGKDAKGEGAAARAAAPAAASKDADDPLIDAGPLPDAKGPQDKDAADKPQVDAAPQQKAPEKDAADTEATGKDAAVSAPAQQKPAVNDDEDKTEVIRPKRDIYAMTGRARPQKIEARSTEPKAEARKEEPAREVSEDQDKTEVIRPEPARDAQTGAEVKSEAEEKKTEKKSSTIPAVGAVGAAGAAGAAAANNGDKPADRPADKSADKAEAKPVNKQNPYYQEPQSEQAVAAGETNDADARTTAFASPAAAQQNQPKKQSQLEPAPASREQYNNNDFAQEPAQQPAQNQAVQREESQTSSFGAAGAGAAGAAAGAAGGYAAANRNDQGAQQPVREDQYYDNRDAQYGAAPQYNEEQAVVQGEAPVEEAPAKPVREKRGTLGFGILLLRLIAGGFLTVTGLQYLFGLGEESGLSTLEGMLANYNYTDMLAVGLAVAALVGGALMIIGLLTPLGAALGVVAAGFLALHFFKDSSSGLWPTTMDPQFVLWALIAVISLAVIFTGPARAAFDRSRGWATRPLASAWIFAIIALGGLGALWFFTGGGNPLG